MLQFDVAANLSFLPLYLQGSTFHSLSVALLIGSFGKSTNIAIPIYHQYPPPHANSFVLGPAVINTHRSCSNKHTHRKTRTHALHQTSFESRAPRWAGETSGDPVRGQGRAGKGGKNPEPGNIRKIHVEKNPIEGNRMIGFQASESPISKSDCET